MRALPEILVDNFAGGGGASTGIELAIGRTVDIAVNHDQAAIDMHTVNHPTTRHYCEDVWRVDPVDACEGHPVGLAWFSPDCKHFSKAKGGKPVNKNVRGLAWLAVKWAKAVKPRIIMLENVEEFQAWGPVVDGRPCPKRKGQTFGRFVSALKGLGYVVAWKELRACDYGAPTSRKRLFLVARCDGKAITWPAKTHGPGLLPYRTAAECIDWSIPCPSIFERKKPLADATLRRIARGVMKYVVDAAEPFIVNNMSHNVPRGVDEPMAPALTGNHKYLVVPTLVQTGYGERPGQAPRCLDLFAPLGTAVDGQKHALVAAFLAKHNGVGEKMVVGQSLEEPMHTITSIDQKAVVSAFIKRDFGTSTGSSVEAPMPTITTDGGGHASLVHAFLMKYYGTPQNPQLDMPLDTIRTKDCFGLVYVHGEPHRIVDIGMRMLSPRELFAAQGFPADYIIGDDPSQGLILTKSEQVRMCGNSVAPPVARALVQANYVDATRTVKVA